MPVGGGPEIELKNKRKEGTSWEGSSDFVFAFRVRKVRVEKKTGTVKYDDDKTDGAMLGDEIKKVDVPELSFAEVNLEPESERFEREELMEGDAVVACGIPIDEEEEEESE